MPTFAVRARCYAAAHFEWDDVLHVHLPEGHAVYQSEYTGGEDGRAYAVTIHGEIRGEGTSLEEAEPRLAAALRTALPVVAVASNAAVEDALLICSHGVDLSQPQPFIGYRTPGPTEWFPPGRRQIDTAATLSLLQATGAQPKGELLLRAYEAYRRALGHWFPEALLLAGEFLFIAAETLSRFLIESRAEAKGLTPKNLAKLEGEQGPELLRKKYLREEVFGGESSALQAMDQASNGFEHGYMAISQIRGLFEGALARSMALVRRSLIEASRVEEAAKETLLNKYDEPRGLVPSIAFVRGMLSAVDPANPPPLDVGAIELDWDRPELAATETKEGGVEVKVTVNPRLHLKPDNVTLAVSHVALRAAHLKPIVAGAHTTAPRSTPGAPRDGPQGP